MRLFLYHAVNSYIQAMHSEKRISFRSRNRPRAFQMGLRLIAAIVDSIVLSFAFYLISILGSDLWTYGPPTISFTISDLFIYAIYWPYFAFFESTIGGTPGKLFLRLKVMDVSGEKLSLTKAILRYPLKLLSALSIIGVLMIDFNKKKQALHDVICGTVVVDG